MGGCGGGGREPTAMTTFSSRALIAIFSSCPNSERSSASHRPGKRYKNLSVLPIKDPITSRKPYSTVRLMSLLNASADAISAFALFPHTLPKAFSLQLRGYILIPVAKASAISMSNGTTWREVYDTLGFVAVCFHDDHM